MFFKKKIFIVKTNTIPNRIIAMASWKGNGYYLDDTTPARNNAQALTTRSISDTSAASKDSPHNQPTSEFPTVRACKKKPASSKAPPRKHNNSKTNKKQIRVA